MDTRQEKLNLVRTILNSPIFHAQPLEQKQQTLNQIIATGEVTRNDVLQLIQETIEQRPEQNQEPESIDYFSKLPYDIFVKLIDTGQIKGKDLFRLCNTSSKLRGYCLKDRKYIDKNGKIFKTETQYVYRKALEELGIEIGPQDNPREIYARYFGSYDLWQYAVDNGGTYTKIEGMNFCKQVKKEPVHTIILDAFGKVWTWGKNTMGELGLGRNYETISIPKAPGYVTQEFPTDINILRQVPNLINIVQVDAGLDYSAALDSQGIVWTCGLVNEYNLPDNFSRYSQISWDFKQLKAIPRQTGSALNQLFDLPLETYYGKVKSISCGSSFALITRNSNLFKSVSENVPGNQYVTVGLRFISTNVKYVKCKRFVSSGKYVKYGDAFSRELRYANCVMITNDNKLYNITDLNNIYTIALPSNPKKAIPNDNYIIILDEEGKVWMNLSNTNKLSEIINPYNIKIVDVDAYSKRGYCVGANGRLYLFHIVSDESIFLTDNLSLKNLPPDNNGIVSVSINSNTGSYAFLKKHF